MVRMRREVMMQLRHLYWTLDQRRVSILVAVTVIIALIVLPFVSEKKVRYSPCQPHPIAHDANRFELDNSGEPFGDEIAPNIVHFYRTGKDIETLTLADAVCLMGAFHNAKPDRIMIHTDDVDRLIHTLVESQYGKRLMNNDRFRRKLDVKYWPAPKHVFGIEFSDVYKKQHVQDVTRIRILRKYGGIFVDNRAYVTRDLSQLRRYEMSALESEGLLSNALMVAHRDARMLDMWLKSYHMYDPSLEVHHLGTHMLDLYNSKATLAHKARNSILKGNVHSLIDDNGALKSNFDTIFAVEIDPHFGGLVFEPGMGEEYILTLVEKQFNS
ncbi:uncharacterized protein LOC111043978 isoform X2 [Nilaparvata lugens]|uniref:uncharacterized protein LOC111043978 isoform X2 n=1 Tax=Nilaparvata lugens TaxID=108931 RepID=UPI00193C8BB4|nr:uncharacterized protein LOC111043978 isoform X2 [Nilaparvata lugens]